MDTNDKTNKTRFKRSFLPVLYIIGIIVFVALIVIEIVAIVNYSKQPPIDKDPTPVMSGTPTPESTASSDPTPAPTGAATDTPENGNTPSQETQPTAASTTTPSPTPTSGPQQTPAKTGIDDIAARIIDPADIDFSFLDGVSRDKFEDSGDSYDWYCGAVKKDQNGKITYPWDRYPSTLNYLKQYGGIYRKNADQKVVYLTFDCGYENGNTNSILDTLKEKNVQAIFFVTGGFVDYGEMTQKMMRRMLDEGHLIGSHTENHKVMPTLSDEEFCNELNSLYRKLKNVLGEDFTMLFYRPPQGASCPRDLALASYLGYHTTFWAFAYGDYNTENQPDPEASLQKMKDQLHPGCVFLLHAVSKTNATILGDLIDYIRAEGYEIRRIDQ
ncbi:MAG: polysaccharide deacetylase family protein [Clostridia bacterium]|nr:polysaccharide deacetylase family protein [Clostridia bacterium]